MLAQSGHGILGAGQQLDKLDGATALVGDNLGDVHGDVLHQSKLGSEDFLRIGDGHLGDIFGAGADRQLFIVQETHVTKELCCFMSVQAMREQAALTTRDELVEDLQGGCGGETTFEDVVTLGELRATIHVEELINLQIYCLKRNVGN